MNTDYEGANTSPHAESAEISYIGQEDCVAFRTINHLQALIRQRAELLLQTENHQFLGVSGIGPEDFSKLSQSRDRGTIPFGCKFDYDGAHLSLVVKMPGPRHEIPIGELVETLSFEMRLLGIGRLDYAFARATGFRGPTSTRSKEADEAFLPFGRVAPTKFPSFVIEVGVSEGITALRRDADYWIPNSSNACNLVLLMSLNRRAQILTFELYQPTLVPGTVTRANPNPPQVLRAGPVHPPIVLRANGVTSGPADLRLPLAALFDTNPVPGTPAFLNQDIVVGAADLQIIYQKTFAYSV